MEQLRGLPGSGGNEAATVSLPNSPAWFRGPHSHLLWISVSVQDCIGRKDPSANEYLKITNLDWWFSNICVYKYLRSFLKMQIIKTYLRRLSGWSGGFVFWSVVRLSPRYKFWEILLSPAPKIILHEMKCRNEMDMALTKMESHKMSSFPWAFFSILLNVLMGSFSLVLMCL